jgi:hypothetical protein
MNPQLFHGVSLHTQAPGCAPMWLNLREKHVHWRKFTKNVHWKKKFRIAVEPTFLFRRPFYFVALCNPRQNKTEDLVRFILSGVEEG